MNELDLRVATLAALFASDRAETLLARLGTPGKIEATRHALWLARLPRRGRLDALAAALAIDGGELRARAEAALSAERPSVRAVLRGVAASVPDPRAAPLLLRLCRERIAG